MTILELLKDKGCEQKRKTATEYGGPCPWCGGDDRFFINPSKFDGKGQYGCRKCNRRGDSIKLFRQLTGASHEKACEELGISSDWKPGQGSVISKPSWIPTEHKSPDELWQKKAGEFVDKCSAELLNHSGALKWLATRGINPVSAKKYKLGWNGGREEKDAYRPRKAWGLKEIIKPDGKSKPLWLPAGLVIPCFVGGKVCRIRIRRTAKGIEEGEKKFKNHNPKYYIVPGSKSNTFVLEPERKVFVIVEAELDAIAVAQAGDIAGAVSVGSLSVKPDAYATEVLRKAGWIYNALDFELEGKSGKGGLKSIKWWQDHFEKCERYPVPRGKDPGEAVQAGVDLGKWIEDGLPPVLTISIPKEEVKKATEAIKKAIGVPDGVYELKELMEKAGIVIMNTEDDYGLEGYDVYVAQKYYKEFRRMSELVFLPGFVKDYLLDHPANIITGENIIYNG